MTTTATTILGETAARDLAARIDAGSFGADAVDASEVRPDLWQVVVYFAGGIHRKQRAALGRLAAWAFAELPDTDWVSRSLSELKPVRAGRILVHGSHDRAARRPNDVGIEIEAGEAFGTGHHGTTAGCLLAIAGAVRLRPVRRALDVGTGSGVLAIAIARLTRAAVVATDIDPVATRVAQENVRLNGVHSRVTLVTSGDLRGATVREGGPYDLIVANILAGPLAALAPSIREHAAPGAAVILSGLLPEQRARIVAAYGAVGLRLRRWFVREGWLTVVLDRPSRR